LLLAILPLMASLPLFFHQQGFTEKEEVWPAEETARHVLQVLRMQSGEQLQLTDGKGNRATATIAQVQKKKFSVIVDRIDVFEKSRTQLHLAVAFTKNTARNEWLLEKITEMGVSSIIPLITQRTERDKIRYDRWHNILVSAIQQSQQFHLPELKEAAPFRQVLAESAGMEQRLLAHCIDEKQRVPISEALQPHKETIIFIGPEGDFTPDEVDLCEAHGFKGLSLSNNRLRTETASMAACAYFNLVNYG
jgi:16S rRNA (uracil1498-N3)-methyltransferase